MEAEKCEFHVNFVGFLSYIIESGQVKTDPDKTQTVAQWPKPFSFKQLQRFLTASEMAELLVTHVVHLHGILADIVSDRGPQFISREWKMSC